MPFRFSDFTGNIFECEQNVCVCHQLHLVRFCVLNLLFPFIVERVRVLEDRSLRIDDVTIEDMGEYSCEADNAVGSITASGTLRVHCE